MFIGNLENKNHGTKEKYLTYSEHPAGWGKADISQ